MYLLKATGATYRKVIRQSKHAFPHQPKGEADDRFVLLSKNKEDCTTTERQIQHVAKILNVRDPHPGELDKAFSGVDASTRWRCVGDLYWGRPLVNPFNLSEVAGLNYKRYDTVQNFAALDHLDAVAVVKHLEETNPELLLEFVNEAERPS